MTSFFFCRGWSDLDKISQTSAEWHVDCGDVVEIETKCRIPIYGGRLGKFNGMSSQSHVSLCRVGLLPLGEFTFMIPEPHATLQGTWSWHLVTWRNQCHDRATLQDVRFPSAIMKIVFRHILVFFCFLNAVRALTSGGFRIVSDTLVFESVLILFTENQNNPCV